MPGPDSSRPRTPPEQQGEEGARDLHVVGEASGSATATSASSADNRPLKELEVRVLRKVFGEGLSYGPVRLVRMSNVVAMINGSRAFVLGNSLNLPGRDFTAVSRGQRMDLLVHEAIHVWQYQRHGWSYVTDALRAQYFGDGYDYVKALRAGKSWRAMNPEQQAQLIQDAYRGSYFDAPGGRFGVVGNSGKVVSPGSQPPADFTDYTPVLVAALEELQKRA